MFIGRIADETLLPVEYEGSKDAHIAVLLDEKKRAPRFAMRLFSVKPGGHTPRHSHWWEHEIFVLEGSGELWINGEWYPLAKGSYGLVEPDEEHQFAASPDEEMRFLCLVPHQT